jgi:Cu(I)/Ag(I) efflux system membrane fusion protein
MLLIGVGYGLWQKSAFQTSTKGSGRIAFYQDSMHPWVKSDRPGKCTICAMDLTPINEGNKGFTSDGQVLILSSNNVRVLNVQTEEVKRAALTHVLQVAGTLEGNESRKTYIASPTPGRIQSLAVEFAGVEVEKGQSLITLYSPELVQKRAYLFSLRGDQSTLGNGLMRATANSDPYSGDLLAPQSGVVTERSVYVGQYIDQGQRLLTIVDASVLWFRFDVYERDLAWLRTGQKLEVTTAAVPGKKFPAIISFIEPMLNEATRTVKVRADSTTRW